MKKKMGNKYGRGGAVRLKFCNDFLLSGIRSLFRSTLGDIKSWSGYIRSRVPDSRLSDRPRQPGFWKDDQL